MRANRIEELTRTAEKYPLLADLPAEHIPKLLEIAEERWFEENEIIFTEGAGSERLFLIASGRISLETVAGAQKIVIQTLGAGDTMGWSALTETATTHFQARALTGVQTIAFDGAALSLAFKEDHDFGYEIVRRVLGLVIERLEHTRMQLVGLYAKRRQKPRERRA